MPRDMASLMSQPMAASPPGEDAEQQQRGLQGLMQQGGQGAQGGPPQPNYQQTTAALRHLWEFQKHWQQVMKTPNFGKADLKGPMIDMLADLMGDGYVTLPQTLQMLQDFPTNPLQQRQFVEQHFAQDKKAEDALLQHYRAAAGPPQPGDMQKALAAKGGIGPTHAVTMSELAAHYKARSGRRR